MLYNIIVERKEELNMSIEIDVFGNVIKKVKQAFKVEEKPLEVKAKEVEVLDFKEEELAKPVEEVVTEEETAEAIEEIMEEFPPIKEVNNTEEVEQHSAPKKSSKKNK